jgi:hypothetical protein
VQTVWCLFILLNDNILAQCFESDTVFLNNGDGNVSRFACIDVCNGSAFASVSAGYNPTRVAIV